MKEQLTQERLKELLDYNQETGHFYWKTTGKGRGDITKPAGVLHLTGYINIKVDGKQYPAHRLAFLWMNESFPEDQVDHINHIRDDNRWSNLREVTIQENSKNRTMSSKNTSGFHRVCWNKRSNKWQSNITIDGRQKHLGLFTTPEEAHQAYQAKALELGFHPNHGRAA